MVAAVLGASFRCGGCGGWALLRRRRGGGEVRCVSRDGGRVWQGRRREKDRWGCVSIAFSLHHLRQLMRLGRGVVGPGTLCKGRT
ncbi:hypothetical protein E2C01_068288 [Portunus trituberculatus]|uniref:Uncharacterized protein n=1 Tax=Portunus trituberculatus TaxID=210409 RepID=A0A5B7HVU8_PORTR|nr:hypothetical protein [Portunus trituberculatus]